MVNPIENIENCYVRDSVTYGTLMYFDDFSGILIMIAIFFLPVMTLMQCFIIDRQTNHSLLFFNLK